MTFAPYWFLKRSPSNFLTIYSSKRLKVVDNAGKYSIDIFDTVIRKHVELLILVYVDSYHRFVGLAYAFICGYQGIVDFFGCFINRNSTKCISI